METTRKEIAARLLKSLQAEAGQETSCDSTALYASLDQESLQLNQLPIKIISILGGLLSALLFTGFLLILGLWQSGSGMFILGLLFIGISLLVISQDIGTYFSATAIAFLVIGLALYGAGIGIVSDSSKLVCLGLMLISGSLLVATTHGLVLFLLSLTFLGSSLYLINTDTHGILHLFVALHTGLILYWCLYETTLMTINKRMNEAYRPIRMGIVLSFAFLMMLLSGGSIFNLQLPYPWISGMLLLLGILAFAWHTHQRLYHGQAEAKRGYVPLLMPLLLFPLVLAPGVVGSFLLILLAFHIRHLSSLIVGIAAFCYTLFLFYYDLQLSLLEKSGLLLLCGSWFLLGYILLKRYEK